MSNTVNSYLFFAFFNIEAERDLFYRLSLVLFYCHQKEHHTDCYN